jgi:glycosyltransferase involved in cell wall biosynthesis
LESVAAQQLAPAEVIVVDDGSEDETAAEAERHAATVVRHEVNRGCAIARNSGLAVATQPWIAMLDSDDEWLPCHLASLWPLRGDHLILANSALECADGPGRDRLIGAPAERPLLLDRPASLIHPGNPIPNSAALIRRDAIEAAGGFRPPRVDDLDLWLRLLERGTGCVSPVVGAIYNLHPRQISGSGAANQRMHETVVRRFEDRPWWSDVELERWRGKAAWNDLRSAVRSRRAGQVLREGAYLATSRQRAYGAFSAGVLRSRLKRRCARRREAARSQRIPQA